MATPKAPTSRTERTAAESQQRQSICPLIVSGYNHSEFELGLVYVRWLVRLAMEALNLLQNILSGIHREAKTSQLGETPNPFYIDRVGNRRRA